MRFRYQAQMREGCAPGRVLKPCGRSCPQQSGAATGYQTLIGSQEGVSETVFHAAPAQDPIVAPSPLPSGG